VSVENQQTKEEQKKGKPKRLTNEQIMLLITGSINQALAGSDEERATDSRAVTRQAIKLTPVAARQLLDQFARDIQYPGKFTKKDLDLFVKEYNKSANAQLETVVRAAKEQITPGASEGEARKVVSNLLSTSYPNFFNPETFTKDFIWSRINFADEASLTGKSLAALQRARGIVNQYGKYIIAPIELENYAKRIARGEISDVEFVAELNQKAARDYPNLANRLSSTPGATPKSLVQNYINYMAEKLEMDANMIDLDHPYIQKAIRPDGPGGSQPMMSIPDFDRLLEFSPEIEGTTKSIDRARQAATSLARAMGFGV
jgi:hypothetical protein